jgi:hypothetical protein
MCATNQLIDRLVHALARLGRTLDVPRAVRLCFVSAAPHNRKAITAVLDHDRGKLTLTEVVMMMVMVTMQAWFAAEGHQGGREGFNVNANTKQL